MRFLMIEDAGADIVEASGDSAMSWNKTLLHSLKSRTVLLYALLFLVSYTIVFVIVYLHLLRAEKEETDWRLHRIFSAFEYRYFTGEELRNSLVVLPKFSRIPKDLFRHIAEEVAGFLPVLACRETRNRDSYIVFGFRGKEIWRVTYETDPPHFSKERILPEEHTAVLAKDFAQESFGEGARLVSLLLDRNRRIVASSPSVEPDRERFRRFDYAHSSARLHYGDMENSRGRRIRLAWKSLPDGNMLVIGLNQHAADENLDRIVREFPALPLWVRTPVVRGFNDNEADIRDMARHVAQLPTVTRHELLPCLPVGEEKYAQLGMVRSQLANVGPDSAQLQELRAVVAACRREARHGRAEGEA